MKRLLVLALLLIAATTTDQLDADFAAGTLTSVNATNNSIILAGSPGNYSLSGTYLSTIKDLGSRPQANISWNHLSPAGTTLLVSSRSGNTSSPDGTWTAWSGSYGTAAGSTITGSDRYHQYRLELGTTNQAVTPTVQVVTLAYTERGPLVQAWSGNAVLNEQTTGTYRFSITGEDTATLTTVQARTRIGSATYGVYQNMVAASGGRYYIDVSEPLGGWSTVEGQLLSVNIYVQNALGDTVNTTFTDLVDNVNTPPILNPIADTTATEKQQRNLFISGFDPDNDNISFSATHGSIQPITATSAYIVWTPTNQETGLVDITATVTDGMDSANRTFTVNVTDVNDAPILYPITNQSGYYGDRIVFTLTVEDNDTGQNMSYWVEPDLFDVEHVETVGNAHTGRANFTAFDDHRGVKQLTFWVSDGEASDSQNTTLRIDYCGDDVCQAIEEANATYCARDCGSATPPPSYIAVEVPDRLCSNQSIPVTTYEASSRYTCHYEGKTINSAAYCSELEAVDIAIYEINGSKLTNVAGLTTNSSGGATFTSGGYGEYKFVATKDDHVGTTLFITVKDCDADISDRERVITAARPDIEASEPAPEDEPRTERPQLTPEEASLLSIFLWYVLAPILLAGLVYTSSVYYDLYKDADPRLLKARIKIAELRERIAPVIMPYYARAEKAVYPYLKPAWEWLQAKAIIPAQRFLAPYAKKVLNLIRR